MLIDRMKENSFTLRKARSRWYSPEIIVDADDADDLVHLANTPAQAKYSVEQTVRSICLYMSSTKTEFMSF